MAQDWQIPCDAICPDEPTCMYCGKFVKQPKQFTQGMMKVMKDLNYGAGAMTAKKTHFIKMIKDKEYIKKQYRNN